VVDPSHGTGIASLVPPMCTASVACGADGIIVEVHPDPKQAVSDASQTITPEAFAAAMEQCRKVAGALGMTMK
jgi:3-deoxy-7-phosphoheptulonate synthase